ncbi:MAG: 4-(cytidine 5'-diphospho)-2-C-methyl-D-erythritol kinase [bacterium]|jgi:4-diphosphocytidyl-2-C-methyl-D-erythritol kinase|nr:MAG: 4-(cytidine 5'-diphospho)-2-C-methyl-D-erythritol kinase [bacterium]
MRALAPAKINLRLEILAREASGYHQIESVFCALSLADELELVVGGTGIRLDVRGADLGPPERNLAYRAAAAFYQAAGLRAGVEIRLTKRVPAGAGLGGGSSDAAATLLALNEVHGHPLDAAMLLRLGAGLGSDVPFFLSGAALALVWGRGERILPLPPLPPAPVLLAVPPFGIATAEAYRALDRECPAAGPVPRVLRLAEAGSWEGLAAGAVNDFEAVLFPRHPLLAALRDTLAHAGARLARLTGSGSAVFGIFDSVEQRAAAAAVLARAFPHVRLIETLTAEEPSRHALG